MKEKRELLIEGEGTEALMEALGPFYIDELRADGVSPKSPPSVKRDWYIVATWLGYSGGEFTDDQKRKISSAWLAYMQIGVAPSFQLKKTFDKFSSDLTDASVTPPPREVMDVFDRLLATDSEIQEKKQADSKAERLRFQRAFNNERSSTKKGWWRRQKPLTRQWMFVSLAWMAIVFGYAWLFDPFDEGGCDYLETEHLYRLYAIALLPVLMAALVVAYRKWVR